jgi:biotin carboxyl carrier protein
MTMRLPARSLITFCVCAAACRPGGNPSDGTRAPDATTTSRLAPGPKGEALITLDTADARRLDLRVVVVGASTWTGEEEAPGEVITEPERVTTVRSALAGRFVVDDGVQWPTYGATVSAGTIVGRVADAKPLVIAWSGTVTRIGAQPGELVEAGQVILEVTDFSHPVVKVAWLDGEGHAPPARVFVHPAIGLSIGATLVGGAPLADEASRAPAFLYRADHTWSGARPGVLVRASWATGAPTRGVIVPTSGVVQWDGLTWAFVEVAPGQFSRRPVPADRPADRGWFATQGWAAGDRVVVRGAQALLSEEFRSRITVGDETGD